MFRTLLFIFLSIQLNAQTNSVKTILSWFEKSNVDSISQQIVLQNYRLSKSTDSTNYFIRFFEQKSTNFPEKKLTLVGNDTSLTFYTWDVYGHQEQGSINAQLRSLRFKQLGARMDGNFITTTFDNGLFLIEQGYQAVDNPEQGGQIPLYQYRIYRKFGAFDKLNGVKELFQTDKHGDRYLAVRETYQNGLLNGPRTLFYPNAKIRLEENYVNGRLSGKQNEYNENGLLIHSATYSYNWHYGPEKWFNNEGEVIHSVNWQRDIKTGQEIEKKEGKTVRLITYKKGIPNGKALLPIYSIQQDSINEIPEMLEELYFVNGQKNGRFYRFMTATKDTIISGSYLNNNYQGTVRTYNEQKLLYAINYADGLKHGTELVYENATNYSGNVLIKKYYKKGIQDSVELLLVTNGEHTGDTAKISLIKNGKYYGEEVGKFYPSYTRNNVLIWKPYSYIGNYDTIQMKRTFSIVYADSISIQGHYFKGLKDSVWIKTVKEKSKLTVTESTYKFDVLSGSFKKKINTNYQESGIYVAGKKEGKWTIIGDSLSDNSHPSSLMQIEHYTNNMLHGLREMYQNNLLIRKDSLVADNLISTLLPNPQGFIAYTFDSINFGIGKAFLSVSERRLDTLISYSLAIILNTKNGNYLKDWFTWLNENPTKICSDVFYETPEFQASISKDTLLEKAYLVVYKTSLIHQYIEKSNNQETLYFEQNKTPYTGELISPFNNCHYTIKTGYLHGWTTYFNGKGIPIKQVKFKKGIVKKVKAMN